MFIKIILVLIIITTIIIFNTVIISSCRYHRYFHFDITCNYAFLNAKKFIPDELPL